MEARSKIIITIPFLPYWELTRNLIKSLWLAAGKSGDMRAFCDQDDFLLRGNNAQLLSLYTTSCYFTLTGMIGDRMNEKRSQIRQPFQLIPQFFDKGRRE